MSEEPTAPANPGSEPTPPMGIPTPVPVDEQPGGAAAPADAIPAADVEPSRQAAAEVAEPGGPDELEELEELTLPATVQAPPPLAPDTSLGPDGRLRVATLLGTLGRINRYAAVWQDDDGQPVDVELREGPADHDELGREAEVLEAVRYAMLPRWYATFTQGDRQYLVLARADGSPLEEVLTTTTTTITTTTAAAAGAGLDRDSAVSVALQLAQVLRRLHAAGWALPGLSPADVLLGHPLRLIGLAGARRIGETPQPLHIPGYSAPELAQPAPLTGKEDVYALGAILYHALVGQPLPESGAELAPLANAVRIPGGPQLLALALAPSEERADLESFYQQLLQFKERLARVAVILDVASATSLGLNPTRSVNEDACGYATWSVSMAGSVEQRALLCVADGMGGMEAGEVASSAALGAVMNALPPSSLDPVALVRAAAPVVHAAGEGRQMGTTITLVVAQGDELSLAHVGDTRAYHWRAGVLTQLTNDHSLVAAMVASGVLTKQEARGHPDSNKVLRSLGGQRDLPDGYVDTLTSAYGQPSLRLQPGDWVIVCSDGVWGPVDDEQIGDVLGEALDGPAAARALVDRALSAGAPDNATAVVARCLRTADL